MYDIRKIHLVVILILILIWTAKPQINRQATKIGRIKPDSGDLAEIVNNAVDVAATAYQAQGGVIAIRGCGAPSPGQQLAVSFSTFADITRGLEKANIPAGQIAFLWEGPHCRMRSEWQIWFVPKASEFPAFEQLWTLENIKITPVISDGIRASLATQPVEIDTALFAAVVHDLAAMMGDRKRSFVYIRSRLCRTKPCRANRAYAAEGVEKLTSAGISAFRVKNLISYDRSASQNIFPDITLIEFER